MDKHRQFQEDIVSYLMGELSEAERGTLERHLNSCAACRQQLAAFRRTLAADNVIPEIEPSADFHQRVMAAARAAQLQYERHEEERRSERDQAPFDLPVRPQRAFTYRLARLVVFASVVVIALIAGSRVIDNEHKPGKPSPRMTTVESGGRNPAIDSSSEGAIERPPIKGTGTLAIPDLNDLRIEVPPLSLDDPPMELARTRAAIEELHVLRTNAPNPAYATRLDWRLKKQALRKAGIGYEAAFAIRRGLWWLANNQQRDGHWEARRPDARKPGESELNRRSLSNEGVTAAALLAMLGDGHTPRHGKFRLHVARGLQWLRSRQQPDGSIGNREGINAECFLISHALAAAALAEAYGMTGESRYLAPAQRAADYLVLHTPNVAAPDGSLVQSQVARAAVSMVALGTARIARVDVPAAPTNAIARAFASAAGSTSALAYPLEGTTASPITPGMLSLLAPGAQPDTATLAGELPRLRQNPPDPARNGQVYWLCGSAVARMAGGEFWQQWSRALERTLVRKQEKSGIHGGSWEPSDSASKLGGRVLATALSILALETPYR